MYQKKGDRTKLNTKLVRSNLNLLAELDSSAMLESGWTVFYATHLTIMNLSFAFYVAHIQFKYQNITVCLFAFSSGYWTKGHVISTRK